jgi:8-oxo-dGTP diphosphatase
MEDPKAISQDSEQRFLEEYSGKDYPRPAVTVDLVVFTVVDAELHVLLVRRKEHPFQGRWALPGGFVRVGDRSGATGESIDQAAHRELAEETGLPEGSVYLEQLYTFGEPGRDPRTRVITVAYYALVRPGLASSAVAGSDAAAVRWAPAAGWMGEKKEPLSFDHANIVRMAVCRIQGKIDYAPLAFELVPQAFTAAELRSVHEAIRGECYDPGNFRRRFRRMTEDGIIGLAPGKRSTSTRPAKLYRFLRRR